jgi:ABC-type multidrug transport system permease subunit
VELVNVLVPVVEVVFLLFAGFLINNDSIPVFYIWLQYSSFMKYGFSMLTVNEFDGLKFECGNEPICSYNNGTQVLDSYGVYYSDRWIYVIALTIITFAYAILGYVSLRLKAWRRENA